jgi:hypothetical protein
MFNTQQCIIWIYDLTILRLPTLVIIYGISYYIGKIENVQLRFYMYTRNTSFTVCRQTGQDVIRLEAIFSEHSSHRHRCLQGSNNTVFTLSLHTQQSAFSESSRFSCCSVNSFALRCFAMTFASSRHPESESISDCSLVICQQES